MAVHTDPTVHRLHFPKGVRKANISKQPTFTPTVDNSLIHGLFSWLGFLWTELLDLAQFAATRPAARSAEQIGYRQEGRYFYSAAPSPTAGSLPMRSGEAISVDQTRFLNVGFTYNLQGVQLQGVSGTREMVARIVNEQSGWQHSLPMSPRCAFSSDAWFALYTLDLRQVQATLEAHEHETGSRGETYHVEIGTRIDFNALVMGLYITDNFAPALTFRYDQAHLIPLDANGKLIPMYFTKPGSLTIPAWGLFPPVQPNPSQWEGECNWTDPRW
jgi:hypothetical protein